MLEKEKRNNPPSRDDELRKLQERVKELEAQKRKRMGVAGATLRGIGRLLPGLSGLIAGLEESEAFRERLEAVNKRIETNIKKQLQEKSLDEVRQAGEIKDFGGIKGAGMSYDVSVKTLANGKSSIKKAVSEVSPPTIKEKEPMIDVYDEKDHVTVIVEVPGVEKLEDMKLNVSGDKLTLSTNAAKENLKEVNLPCRVKADIADSTYRNGILEVKLEKINDSDSLHREEDV
jgi:HSP20 family protein